MPPMNTQLRAGEHNCFGRLTAKEGDKAGDAFRDRPAMLVYAGKFDSMDGEVTVTEEHIDRLVENHNLRLSKFTANLSAGSEPPLHSAPPLQLDHSASATVTIGRVIGKLFKGSYTDEETGVVAPALFSEKVRVLGKENVEKVDDGRWIHLSIGADLESGKLNELSVTPFPAAANAALLAKRGVRLEYDKIHSQGQYRGEAYQIETDDSGKKFAGLTMGGVVCDNAKSATEALQAIKSFIDKKKDGNLSNLGTKVIDGQTVKTFKDETGWYAKVSTSAGEIKEAGGWDTEKEAIAAVLELKKKIDGKLSRGANMFEKLMTFLTGSKKLAKADAEAKLAKMDDEEKKNLAAEAEEEEKKDAEAKKKLQREKLKKHLMDEKKMSDKDADDHLAKMKEEEEKTLAAEVDEKEKKMAKDKEDAEKLAKMTAKEKFVHLAKGIKVSGNDVQLAARKATIGQRLSKIRAANKITPAEIKKMDIDTLAKASDESVNLALKTYEDREPVLDVSVYGTSKAVSMSKIHAKYKAAKLELETRLNMPSKADDARVQLSQLKEKEDLEIRAAGGEPQKGESEDTMSYELVCQMLDEGHDKERVKASIKKMLEDSQKELSGSTGSEEKRMSALVETTKTLQTQMGELIQLVGPSLGVEEKDLG